MITLIGLVGQGPGPHVTQYVKSAALEPEAARNVVLPRKTQIQARDLEGLCRADPSLRCRTIFPHSFLSLKTTIS